MEDTSSVLGLNRDTAAAVLEDTVYQATTQCPFCSVQCKAELTIETRRTQDETNKTAIPFRHNVTEVKGKDNKASEGRICVKGLNAHQHAVSKRRLTSPLIKKDGKLTDASWEEAIQFIADRLSTIQKESGRDAVGVYGGGSLTNETAYLLGKFARLGLGTKYIDYNGRFCMSAAASAGAKVFGMDRGLTFPLSDIEHAECIILAGTNIAECQPTLMPYFTRAQANGAQIIVIDPRRTSTAAMADLHLAVRPGMDMLLADGLLKLLKEQNMLDDHFIKDRTNGYEELEAYLSSITIEHITEQTGITEDKLRLASEMFGKAKTAMVLTARGVEQQTDGHLAVRHFINLLLATGNIGRKGCGYGAVTGQGNGQGGREHGQKADQLPGYRSIEDDQDRSYIASVWGVKPEELPRKGVSAYEMMELVHTGEIKALFVMGSNPIVSNPNATLVEEGLEHIPFLAVADMFLSETARLADVVLPVSSYMENTGTLTNLEGRVLLREAAAMPPGECRHDWEILRELAHVLGRGHFFNFNSSEAIFNELRVASRGGIADYYGITYERLRKEEGIYWPCPSEEAEGAGRIFEEHFAHADGRAIFTAQQSEVLREGLSKEFPLMLTNGRVLSHYLTGVQTRLSPGLASRQIENFVEIHPDTARHYMIREHSWVKVTSRYGEFQVRCRFNEQIRKDTLFVPMHWGGVQNVNRATRGELDPFCKMPGFKTTAVRIELS
ncbi:molybdopterin oxidoreductase family protein [Neobacillus mesonae]|nr:molybdopterin oxidoreductase family protein [Neobacillus mesonae]